MPANTSPDNIQYPVAGDQIAPLNTVFQNLAETTQTALAATRTELTNRLVVNVADFTALAALSTAGRVTGDLAFVVEGEVYMSLSGSTWRQVATATFATAAARDTAYAKAAAAYRVVGVAAYSVADLVEYVWRGSASWVPVATNVRAFSTTDGTGNISSSTFAVLPTVPTSTSLTVPTGGQFARITLTFTGACNAGNLDVGVAVSGGTTSAADRLWTGSAFATRNAAFALVVTPTFSLYTLTKLMPLTQGSNTFTVQARIGGAGGTKQVQTPVLTVELI